MYGQRYSPEAILLRVSYMAADQSPDTSAEAVTAFWLKEFRQDQDVEETLAQSLASRLGAQGFEPRLLRKVPLPQAHKLVEECLQPLMSTGMDQIKKVIQSGCFQNMISLVHRKVNSGKSAATSTASGGMLAAAFSALLKLTH